ncbi:MAG: type II toxin-antitoxin system HicB family antitoxin [Ignavibacteria bacterium]|nr:type II toxin-antitoxin system HicB family antitoxin [Ignavibacteria bacterium]
MSKRKKQDFNVIVERDEDGYYIASVPELPGSHTQARSLDKTDEGPSFLFIQVKQPDLDC